jgi:hypothetical protein
MIGLWSYLLVGMLFSLFIAVLQWTDPVPGQRWYYPIANTLLWPYAVLIFIRAFLRRRREVRQ